MHYPSNEEAQGQNRVFTYFCKFKLHVWLHKSGQKIPGRVHICNEAPQQIGIYPTHLSTPTNLTYLSERLRDDDPEYSRMSPPPFDRCPGLVFYYVYNPAIHRDTHSVFYRPSLLNGRHIVDVLRAVCGPADVSEAELDRVRREATEGEEEEDFFRQWDAVWRTEWYNTEVTAQHQDEEV